MLFIRSDNGACSQKVSDFGMLKEFRKWRVAKIYLDRLIDENEKRIRHTSPRKHDIPSESLPRSAFSSCLLHSKHLNSMTVTCAWQLQGA